MPQPKQAATLFFGLLFGIVAAAFAFNTLLNHRVVAHAYAPKLTLHPQPARPLAFRTLDGEPRQIASAHGKVVVVNLWGTWCLPCIAEIRTFQRLYDRFRDDPRVAFFFIAQRDTAPQVRNFATRKHLTLPFYLAADDSFPLSAEPYIPTTLIYAPDGSLAATYTGAADWADPSVSAFVNSLKR